MKHYVVYLFLVCCNCCFAQGKLTFKSKAVDLGTMFDNGSTQKALFYFKNTGNEPIGISRATTSFGDITYPQTMILPNEQGTIEVTFSIRGKFPGELKKSVTVKTTSDDIIRLSFFGIISDEPAKRMLRENEGYTWYQTYNNGKYGAQTKNGNTILEDEYKYISYIDGKFVANKDNKLYVFSKTGSPIWSLECECDYFSSFDENRVIVKQGDTYALYDLGGKCYIPFNRKYTSIKKVTSKLFGTYYEVKDGNTGAFCNNLGKEVFRIKSNYATHPNSLSKHYFPYFNNGRFIVRLVYYDGRKIWEDVFIDFNGQVLCRYEYDGAMNPEIDELGNILVDGRHIVSINNKVVIDDNGKIIIDGHIISQQNSEVNIGSINKALKTKNPLTM